jgi:hypothetical protein
MRPPKPLLAAGLALGAALAPAVVSLGAQPAARPADTVPLPEHPRPDFLRADWVNLNGRWQFAFDAAGRGERLNWHRDPAAMPSAHRVLVPFSWGSPASGVPDSADVAWYARPVTVPAAWAGRRVFLVVGASDWRTSAWLDGRPLGTHQGGYTPFSMELTAGARPGAAQRLVLRVDDTDHPFKLEGKQGYGKARGPWQTVYLEARGAAPLEYVHFTPDVPGGRVTVEARLLEPAPRPLTLALTFGDTSVRPVRQPVAQGARTVRFTVPVPNARLWRLEDPYLYEATAALGAPGLAEDRVQTYFGMRSVGVARGPGGAPYVALNGRPVYLQLALDQAYHPTGYYTFPTDSVLRDEILRARKIGLNGLREHIKVEAPRKLYWADRLGVLIMADVPNWWGPPDSLAFREHEAAMRGMIARDYNHPSVFSWIAFNETWGLRTKGPDGKEVYRPETQAKVASVQQLAKRLDPTRPVEDNSVCCGAGHTTTDLNTWHEYLAGWQWPAHLRRISDSTFAGSTWNFERGYRQGGQPMFNSEFGNVWGYEGSTGDVDYSWDYHQAIDVFRRTPKLAGWLYTEHHDVINEWNGYWRFDRSDKETGVGALAPGMTLADFHAPYYVAVGEPGALSQAVAPGARVDVPLYASFLTDQPRAAGDSLVLRAELHGWNALGEHATYATASRRVAYRPWLSEALAPLPVTMPAGPAVAVLAVRLEDAAGTVLHRNFATFVVGGAPAAEVALSDGRRARLASVPARAVADARWSLKRWDVLGGRKVNGAGSGFAEYRIPWPAGLRPADVAGATFLAELSAKRLLGKDRDTTAGPGGDYMRGGGLQDPGKNPNAYPMTGAVKYPSAVTVRANGELAARVELADDPADSRGVLSWHAQPKGDPKNRRLQEAGSYGELVRVALPPAALAKAAATGQVVVRLEVDAALPGGLAVYGREFGRYPVDPSVLFVLRGGAAPRAAEGPPPNGPPGGRPAPAGPGPRPTPRR